MTATGESFVAPDASTHRRLKGGTVVREVVAALLVIVALLGFSGDVAYGVVGGKTVSITAVPWTVVIWKKSPYPGEVPYHACTGVIIGSRDILTAGHCVTSGDSVKPLPSSSIGVEAGTSNLERLPASDHPQASSVAAIRVMPGYIAGSKLSSRNAPTFAGHDLAVLRLVRPLVFNGNDVRAASLPGANTPPPGVSELVIAGFGDEKLTGSRRFDGTLNEAVKPRVLKSCTTSRVLCVYMRTNTCLGDSGLGAIEPGRVPTVVGILSLGFDGCRPGSDYFVSLTAPAVRSFLETAAKD